MDWHESATEGLPRPHPDEPESLRRDIADELGDHLACAYERERARTPDEPTARRAMRPSITETYSYCIACFTSR